MPASVADARFHVSSGSKVVSRGKSGSPSDSVPSSHLLNTLNAAVKQACSAIQRNATHKHLPLPQIVTSPLPSVKIRYKMAQLHTEKEKYGVSVAARIDPNMAHQIADRAERMGLSFAKMVSLLISRGFDPQEPVRVENREEIERLEEELAEVTEALETLQTEDEANRSAIGLFIQTITSDVDEQRTHLNTFKTIRDELRDQQ
jgi:hypothetical protein